MQWRTEFQTAVNQIVDGDYLTFTCSVWLDQTRREIPENQYDNKVTVETGPAFPYLDMELFWSPDNELQFRVHLKPNQELKYLNKGSVHTGACFRAIPAGVCNRLAKLTTITNDNADLPLDEIYKEHFKQLRHAELIKGRVPTLREELDRLAQAKQVGGGSRKEKQRERNRFRTTYFCIGFSRAWITPIHSIINRLREEFDLKWLRVSMSYRRFTNLREIFQGDLAKKLMRGLRSANFATLQCNCQLGPNHQGCGYNGHCRKRVIVYETKCNITGKVYIGNTSRHFKRRMQEHFDQVKRLREKGIRSDSYAKHFAFQFRYLPTITPATQRSSITNRILWHGNPLSAVKSFGTWNCSLCNRERLEILKVSRKSPERLINSCNEIYGACRHKPKFHRYEGEDSQH